MPRIVVRRLRAAMRADNLADHVDLLVLVRN